MNKLILLLFTSIISVTLFSANRKKDLVKTRPEPGRTVNLIKKNGHWVEEKTKTYAGPGVDKDIAHTKPGVKVECFLGDAPGKPDAFKVDCVVEFR